MAEYILTEKQLSLIKNEVLIREAEEKWQSLSMEEKEFILEFHRTFYPERSLLIKEASWYNTLGDIVGILDPTGAVDLINGLSYLKQGDTLFGFLSIVSAVPYVGDVIAKPIMGALKIGAPSAKALKNVLELSKAGNSVKAAEELAKLTASGGLTGKFVKGVASVSTKLKEILQRTKLPGLGGVKKTLIQWLELFETGAKTQKAVRTQGANMAKLMKELPSLGVQISKAQQIKNIEQLIKLSKQTPGLFSGYRTSKGFFSWKNVFRGMPQLMNRNASVRSLMRQTKWWAGFLDWMGYGNFVGPEEVEKNLGSEEYLKKMEEYQKTPEAQKNFADQFGADSGTEQAPQSEPTQQTVSTQKDPFQSLFSSLFGFK